METPIAYNYAAINQAMKELAKPAIIRTPGLLMDISPFDNSVVPAPKTPEEILVDVEETLKRVWTFNDVFLTISGLEPNNTYRFGPFPLVPTSTISEIERRNREYYGLVPRGENHGNTIVSKNSVIYGRYRFDGKFQ